MKVLPLAFDLVDAPAVVAGSGAALAVKARLLAMAGARVRLVSAAITPELHAEFAGRAELLARPAGRADFDGARIAVIAEEDADEARRLVEAARAAGALVNAVDRPELCDFQFPALIDRGDVVVSVSTGGAAPALARRIRQQIERALPARLGALASFARRHRADVSAAVPASRRRAFWDRIFDGPIAARILAGDEGGASAALRDAARREGVSANTAPGVVHIVGAGPGDPELLTLRAHRLIGEADVILHDRLVSAEVLALARRDATRIYVGKEAGESSAQDAITERMIELARAGRNVVRLKGGDPFIFGRGGEELAALRAAGIDAHVTPGITAALGCAASASLPLTHRDFAQAVTFVTGHAKADGALDIAWAALARLRQTLVIYMGLGAAAEIAASLIAAGLAPSTPAAVIENGTRPDERILKTRLDGLATLIEEQSVRGPALLVIGAAAALAAETSVDATGASARRAA